MYFCLVSLSTALKTGANLHFILLFPKPFVPHAQHPMGLALRMLWWSQGDGRSQKGPAEPLAASIFLILSSPMGSRSISEMPGEPA